MQVAMHVTVASTRGMASVSHAQGTTTIGRTQHK